MLKARALFLLTCLIGTLPAAWAQAWPEKTITLVVPNAAGGAADNLARGMAEELGRRLRTTVVVENLGGASGALGAMKVLRAPADGYTLLFGTTSDMVVTPVANPSAGYAVKDFTPIARVGATPMTLVARPGLGVAGIDQLVALARSRPGAVSVGVTGNVSLQAFGVVALTRAAGIDLLSVPYKGGAPLINDLLGGQVDLALLALPGSLPHVRAGKMQMLGVLSEARAVSAPEMPTVNEGQAVKGVSIEIWAALAGPPKMPEAIVEKISAAVREVLLDKDFSERRAKLGDMPVPPASAAEFGRFLLAEEARYRALASGLKRD